MPHDATATDSELLASWTSQAINLGRLELAEALIRLAIQARRVESATLVRMAGSTRDEQPARPYTGPQLVREIPPAEQVHTPLPFGADGPTGNGDADLARAEAAATAIFGRVAEKELNVPVDGTRCVSEDRSGGWECHQAIWWVQRPDEPGYWAHVDAAHDDHHQAMPPARS